MTHSIAAQRLMFNPASVRDDFDTTPFGFSHTLHTLDLFSPQALAALAGRYAGHPDDYFVAASAASPGTRFYDVPRGKLPPHEAIARLEHGAWRVLLKRLESHDSGFADLLQALFGEVTAARDDLRDARIVRLESAVFISSAASTTPFHFDPEINHFCQIAGAKTYHVYPPSVLAEHELERFYIKGEVNIGQVDLAGRDPAREHVFQLAPGLGLHQPQHAPHWVETGSARSVSYSFVFETDAARARGRARSANHYLRMLGMRPRLGASAAADRAKARVMAAVLPVRRGVRRALRG